MNNVNKKAYRVSPNTTTVAARIPKSQRATLEKIASQRGENLNVFLRNLIANQVMHSSAVYTLAGNDGATVNA